MARQKSVFSAEEALALVGYVEDDVMTYDESSDEEFILEQQQEEESESDEEELLQDSSECRVDYISKSGDKWTSAPPPVTGRHRAEDVLKQAGGPTLYARSRVENIEDTWRLIFTDKLLETP